MGCDSETKHGGASYDAAWEDFYKIFKQINEKQLTCLPRLFPGFAAQSFHNCTLLQARRRVYEAQTQRSDLEIAAEAKRKYVKGAIQSTR